MYLDFYCLKAKPFSITPNSRFFFNSPSHDDAITALNFGVDERKGFIMLTGEVGTGKTTTIRTFLNNLSDTVKTALVLNPLISVNDLLHTITADLSVPGDIGDSIKDEIARLNQFLLEQYRIGNTAVVIIDEAQDLSTESLEMVRLLSNLETENDKLLQIVLVGQPELESKLAQDILRQLRQRIQIHHRLSPFSEQETAEYINHLIQSAGTAYPVVSFDHSAIKAIYNASKGIPRLINKVCDYALIAGFVNDTRTISKKIVEVGLTDISTVVDGGKPVHHLHKYWPFSKAKGSACH